jgi:polyisoprenoid-binding protein YceI
MTPKFSVMAIAAAAIVFATPVSAADYVIDTKGGHASINFQIKHLGFSWLTGRFDTFSGDFSYDDKKPEASKIKVDIDVTSLNSNHAERDKHLRGADYLDTAKFPKASFVSKSVKPNGDKKMAITGDLTLRGVTKEVTIDAEYIGGGDDPWGGFRQGFAGKTSFALADFGIPGDLGPASKNVDMILHVEGVRK